MQATTRTRVFGIVVALILIAFAFLAILNANLLSWPLASEFGARSSSNNPSGPITGELLLQANLTTPGVFYKTDSGISLLPSSTSPLVGVAASIFSINQGTAPLASRITDSNGSLSINMSEGTYLLKVNTGFSNLSVPISIVSNKITYFQVNLTESDSMASFYDLGDLDSLGQVLPSEFVFLQFLDNYTSLPSINSGSVSYIETYMVGYPIFPNSSTTSYATANTISSTTAGNSSSSLQLYNPNLFSELQRVPASIITTASPKNGSMWITLRPQSPLSTAGVEYVALANIVTTYNLMNPNVGGNVTVAQ